MKFLVYFIISAVVLFLSYRISLSKALTWSALASVFILIRGLRAFPYETMVFVLAINALPFITDRFKKDFDHHKESMRARFEEVKTRYEDLVRQNNGEIESNLEREKKLQQVLSLYEISKDMSGCLSLEDILSIFSSTLRKSFRFRASRLALLNDSREVVSVYQIKTGQTISKVSPDDFDKELAVIMIEEKKVISLFSQVEARLLKRLAIVKDFGTLVAIPLFVEERLAGILYIENLPRPYFENFIILGSQFAIQFQKVVLYKKVQEASITDSLTGVSTRRHFLERLARELRRSMRGKTNLSFLMLDLDHFKEKNDRLGHLVGDVVLKEVAGIIKSNLREIDILGRYGGEEFAIALADTDKEGALQVAEHIRRSIESAIFKAYDEVTSSTVSIGISTFPENGADANSLIESSDRALYKAKESGRNRVC
ncbi:MAG: GGDEF domain-containing protein [Candidatus Gorgyraea atricola]|nr:GGDEF domain-containing protein [Candidatus Gorgyraea atricola]